MLVEDARPLHRPEAADIHRLVLQRILDPLTTVRLPLLIGPGRPVRIEDLSPFVLVAGLVPALERIPHLRPATSHDLPLDVRKQCANARLSVGSVIANPEGPAPARVRTMVVPVGPPVEHRSVSF